MVVKPLAALTVGEEAVTRSTLRRALERGLEMKMGSNNLELVILYFHYITKAALS